MGTVLVRVVYRHENADLGGDAFGRWAPQRSLAMALIASLILAVMPSGVGHSPSASVVFAVQPLILAVMPSGVGHIDGVAFMKAGNF